MKKTEPNNDLRPEYDLKSMLKGGVRGKYAARYRAETNLVLLEPDVAKAFPNEKAVNEALKLVMKLKKVQEEAGRYSTKR
ncbi:MAG: hypothetical protein IT314_01745 [Anaerolineales bacterium]|nr:hypothetical protein [Anaerolineales bacterium]